MAEAEGGGGGGSLIPEGTVKVPGVGRVRKVYVLAGAAVVGVLVVVWWRKRQAAAASSTAAGTITTDSAGNVGVIDPATGFVYGSAEDSAALAQLGQAVTSTTTDTGAAGGSTSPDGTIDTQVTNGPPFTSNAAWSQYATGYLVGTLGMDPGTVANDLGKYLAGEQVTQAERDGVINPAIAYAGQPPIAGPNGFPPSVNVVGSTSGTGSAPGAPTLTLGAVTDTTGVVKWAAVSGATGYAWTASGPSYSKTGSGAATSLSLSGLKAGTSYTVAVHASSSAGAGPTASITVTTKATTVGGGSGSYAEVRVVAFTSGNPPWNSTISGIAQHYGYGGDWQAVWNDPKNASLRAKRGSPEHIQAGDTVWVKRK